MFWAPVSHTLSNGCASSFAGYHRVCGLLLLAFIVAGSLGLGPFSSALVMAQEDSIEQVRDVLEANASETWYDSKTDDYRVPDEFKKRDPLGRQSSWNGSISPINMNNKFGTGSFWSVLGLWLYAVFPYLVGLLLLCIGIVLALWFLKPEYFYNSRKKGQFSNRQIDLERIVDLPFSIESEKFDPLKEIEKWKEAGDYQKATIYLFAYQLLQLDANHRIVLQRGKTNRAYLRELRKHPEIKHIIEPTMFDFEDVFFGRYRITKEKFLENWNRLDQFHQLLSAPPAELNPASFANPAGVQT